MARDCRLAAGRDFLLAKTGQERRFSSAPRDVLELLRVQPPQDARQRAVCPPERLIVPFRALLVVLRVLQGESELLPARSFGALLAWPPRVRPRVLPPVQERALSLQPGPSRASSQLARQAR